MIMMFIVVMLLLCLVVMLILRHDSVFMVVDLDVPFSIRLGSVNDDAVVS
jgi:hypothetical protein